MHQPAIVSILSHGLGGDTARRVLQRIAADPALPSAPDGHISRAEFTVALNAWLFHDLLERVPSGHAYVEDRAVEGAPIVFDHGALRTILFPDGATGALPGGEKAFRRILEPLGYRVAAVYPLPRLRMTGHAFCHVDRPETIPQFFVSELHVDQFDDAFADAAHRVFDSSRDPLDAAALALLDRFARNGHAPLAAAQAALPVIAGAFDRQHDTPALADYEILLAQSGEAGWIATEGNSFNHVTDRVADVQALSDEQRALGRPMKDRVEVSASGTVRQTAFRADPVTRSFRDGDGGVLARSVPGSFYEFITRDIDPATGTLDLRFDSGNATGIFAMTRQAA